MSDIKRILIADDAATVAALLTAALEMDGYEVTSVGDGERAHEEGATGSYDLVIIDQLMPGLLGIEVIAKWRAAGNDVPVMMLSAVDDEYTVVNSLQLGAVDFVRKPFNMQELLARVRRNLG